MSDSAGNKQSTKKDTISSRGINKTPTKYKTSCPWTIKHLYLSSKETYKQVRKIGFGDQQEWRNFG
jgi:hypothetical protein